MTYKCSSPTANRAAFKASSVFQLLILLGPDKSWRRV